MNGTFNGAAGFLVVEQFKGWHHAHIFCDQDHFKQWRKQNGQRRIVGATNARGRCVRGIDHRGQVYDNQTTEESNMNTQANQTKAVAQPVAPTSAKPDTSALLRELIDLSKAQLEIMHGENVLLDTLTCKLEVMTASCQQAADYAMANTQQLAGMVAAIRVLAEAATTPAPVQPATSAPAVASNGNGGEAAAGNYTDFDAEAITVSTDDDGRPCYKVRGGKYGKFGVRVWPEVLPMLGVEVADLKPGPNQFNARVRAVLDEKGQAKKVVGLAK